MRLLRQELMLTSAPGHPQHGPNLFREYFGGQEHLRTKVRYNPGGHV